MRSGEFLREYYEAQDDEYSNRDVNDVRRSRLTLKHLNRLRKQREIHKVEHASRLEKVQQIYRAPTE